LGLKEFVEQIVECFVETTRIRGSKPWYESWKSKIEEEFSTPFEPFSCPPGFQFDYF